MARWWREHPVEHFGWHVPVITQPVDVRPRHRLHGVAQVAGHGNDRGALGEQRRGAPVAARVELEPVPGQPGAPERWPPPGHVELIPSQSSAPRAPRNRIPSDTWSRRCRRSSTATRFGTVIVRIFSALGVVSTSSPPYRCICRSTVSRRRSSSSRSAVIPSTAPTRRPARPSAIAARNGAGAAARIASASARVGTSSGPTCPVRSPALARFARSPAVGSWPMRRDACAARRIIPA
jgi:hypothetical protein